MLHYKICYYSSVLKKAKGYPEKIYVIFTGCLPTEIFYED